MEEIRFPCPHCGQPMTGEPAMYGSLVTCPACGGRVVIPNPSGPSPKIATLGGVAAPPPAEPEPEQEVFELGPSARAFLGHILLGLLFIGLSCFPQPFVRAWLRLHLTPDAMLARVLLGLLLVPAAIGVIMLLVVWVQVHATDYRLTTQRLFRRRGLLAKQVEELELFRVKDVTVDQSMFGRLLHVGNITVLSTDDSTPTLPLVGIGDPIAVKEAIRLHYRAARQREHVRLGEYIQS